MRDPLPEIKGHIVIPRQRDLIIIKARSNRTCLKLPGLVVTRLVTCSGPVSTICAAAPRIWEYPFASTPGITYPFNRCLTIRVRETPRQTYSGPGELAPLVRRGESPRSGVSNGSDFGGVRATRLSLATLRCNFLEFSNRVTLWFENREERYKGR